MQRPVHSQVCHQSSHRTKQSRSPFLPTLIASSLPKRVKVAITENETLINFSSISRKKNRNKNKNLSSSCTLKTLHFIYTGNSNTITQSKNLDITKSTQMRVTSNSCWHDLLNASISSLLMKWSSPMRAIPAKPQQVPLILKCTHIFTVIVLWSQEAT